MTSLLEHAPTLNSAWAKLKFEAEQSQYAPQVRVVGSAFRANLASEYIYISSAISTGNRLYQVAKDLNITPNELKADKDKFNELVKRPNIESAIAIAEAFQSQYPNAVVVSPAIFEANELGWGQPDYLNLWLFEHIIPQTTRKVMTDGWQYSDGAIKEYLTAVMMKAGFGERSNIEIVDQQDKLLAFDKAYQILTEAMYQLNSIRMPENSQAQALHMMGHIESGFDRTIRNASSLAGYSRVWDFDRVNYRRFYQKAEAFLYEMKDSGLLKSIEPAFVAIGGTGKLQYEIPDASVAVLENALSDYSFSEVLSNLRKNRDAIYTAQKLYSAS
jgi:hypothetical protein